MFWTFECKTVLTVIKWSSNEAHGRHLRDIEDSGEEIFFWKKLEILQNGEYSEHFTYIPVYAHNLGCR